MSTNSVRASDISYNEGLLRLAAVHNKTVEFRYAKGDGKIIELRALKPSGVDVVSAGTPREHVTFQGFDPDRSEVRNYRLDRMKGDARVVA